jgi:HTH-type transcriptional regulator / antitoxin HipB
MDYPLKMAEQLRPQLQALRKKRGMTQARLGEAIGVTQARVVEIEANPGVVNLQQIMQVLHALGATLVIRETEKGAADESTSKPVPGPKQGSW